MPPDVFDEMDMDEAFDIYQRTSEMHSADVKMWSEFFAEIAKVIASASGAKIAGGGGIEIR